MPIISFRQSWMSASSRFSFRRGLGHERLMPEQLQNTAGDIAQKVVGSMGEASKTDRGHPEADKPSASSTSSLPSGDTDLDRAIKAH